MKTKIAVRILLVIFTLFTLLHIGVLVNIVPTDIVWEGALKSDEQLYLLESISILITLYFIFLLLIKGSVIRPLFSIKVVNVSLWFFLILFIHNTIGNLLAETTTEKSFALVIIAISLLLWFVLKKRDEVKS